MPGMVLKVLSAAFVLATGTAQAQSPEDIVRWAYTSLSQPGPADAKGLAFLTAPSHRHQYLSRRLIGFYEANESYGNDLATACVDFAFDIPGQDFDAAEIARTLSVGTQATGTGQTVTARFTNFGEPAEITYDFIAEDGFWRLDDIAADWFRVSEIPCTPKTAGQTAAAPSAAVQYCFQTDGDSLRLDVAADGSARFDFDSWQANGHSCSGNGTAVPTGTGWLFERALSGGACRLEFLVTGNGGIRLTDADWICKTEYCGARAVIDGLTFPPENQIACSQLPSR